MNKKNRYNPDTFLGTLVKFLLTFHIVYLSVYILFLLFFFFLKMNALEDATSGGFFRFFRYYPNLGLIPIGISLLLIINILISSKLKSLNKKTYWVVFLFFIFQLGFLIFIDKPWYSFVSDVLAVKIGYVMNPFIFKFFNGNYFYLGLYTILILIFFLSRREVYPDKFHFSLKELNKFVFGGLIVLFVISGIMTAVYGKIFFDDFNYSKVAGSVDYNLYHPEYLPFDLVNKDHYQRADVFDFTEDETTVVYGEKFAEVLNESEVSRENRMVSITQVKVGVDFDLKEYVYNNVFTSHNYYPQVVKSSSYLNDEGYYFPIEYMGEVNVYQLHYITYDNVYIVITGINIPKEEVLKISTWMVSQ